MEPACNLAAKPRDRADLSDSKHEHFDRSCCTPRSQHALLQSELTIFSRIFSSKRGREKFGGQF